LQTTLGASQGAERARATHLIDLAVDGDNVTDAISVVHCVSARNLDTGAARGKIEHAWRRGRLDFGKRRQQAAVERKLGCQRQRTQISEEQQHEEGHAVAVKVKEEPNARF